MKRSWLRFGFGALGILALGCADGEEQRPLPSRVASAELLTVGGCGDAEQALRNALLAEMNRRIDENLANFLDDTFSCSGDTYDEAAGSSGGSGNGSPPRASGTNNQVAGVEEADFVKNDSELVYVAAGSSLHIIDASPAEETHLVSKTPLQGKPKKLLLVGDRVVVYSSIEKEETAYDPYNPYDPYSGPYYPYEDGDCSYGRDCDFLGDGNPTHIAIFDVSNPSSPVLLREMDATGSLIGARGVGSTIHTVVYDERFSQLELDYWPNDLESCNELDKIKGVAKYEALRAKNTKKILTAGLAGMVPSLTDKQSNATVTDVLADCQNFYAPPLEDGVGFLTVFSFDVGQTAAPAAATVISKPGAVYSTVDSLYVAVRQFKQSGQYWYEGSGEAVTAVHKFALEGARPEYAASGLVDGIVLNQFSLDEFEGHLRVVTSSGWTWGWSSSGNALRVLKQNGRSLDVVGRIDDIGPGEDLRAVRFVGRTGYVVTFLETDPLFVLDLSNPTAPSVVSELVIPGFSTYLHPMDPGHLLTVGYQGSSGGVNLQIFDVTSAGVPSLAHSQSVPGHGTSEAAINHLAFNYFAPKGMVAIPFVDCGYSYGAPQAAGLVVYSVSTETGFELVGTVKHDQSGSTFDCGSWSNTGSPVKRSVFIGDYVLSISETELIAAALADLDQKITTISLK